MSRTWFRRFAAGFAGLLLAGTAIAADQAEPVKKVTFVPGNFYGAYLVPRVSSNLQGEFVAARDYVDPTANPWTRDKTTVHRVELGAARAGKNAVRQYLIDTLRIDAWSIPLFQSTKAADAGPGTADTRARLRFGVSHFTPRAELLIPNEFGHVGLSADAKGAVNAMFESHSFTFRVEASYDPRANVGTFTLGRRF